MTSFDIFMFPGRSLLELLLEGHAYGLPQDVVLLAAGIVSWIIWASIIRAAWAITMKLFGFGRQGRY